jgi:branched-chain amino acid transport system ATP-binding protein
LLDVANLEVVYHSVVLVLRGISLQVPDRGVVALLGPNGAGKTTALRAITGLLDVHHGKVTKGRVAWDSDDLLRRRPDEIVRRGIAQVLEGRRILADLTVEENLRAGAYGRGDVRGEIEGPGSAGARGNAESFGESIDRLCARFPILGQRRRQQAGYLSGGEQQMLAIARALIARPKLLILDEPSLGLAPKLQREIAGLIAEINADGVGILLVEQNAAMALDLAQHGYILENGKVVLDGPTADLRADKDIREFYLGLGQSGARSYRQVKLYRRRKRWLS